MTLPKKKKNNFEHAFVVILFILFSLYYFAGLPGIPFHPDESTYLFMSSDFNQLFSNPSILFWQPSLEGTLKQRYRELDAPLTTDLIGTGIWLSGSSPLKVDWNWSKNWQMNVLAGALPDFTQLLIARFSVACLFPFSLALVFMIGKKVRNNLFGMLVSILFATNALILLHTRRAMEESVLVLCVCITICGLMQYQKRPWIAVIGAALAFNAKQSAFAFVPVVLLAICWPYLHPISIKQILTRSAAFFVIFTSITFFLNPFLFSHPIQAIQAAIQARQSFINQQMETMQTFAPEQILSPGERALDMIAQLYILPPSIEDVGNYHQNLALAQEDYFHQPGTTLFRGMVWGSIFVGLTLLGIIFSVLRIIKHGLQSEIRYAFLLIAFFLQIMLLIITVLSPYQRYWVPLIPFTCIWVSIAIFEIAAIGHQVIKTLNHR